MKFFLVFAYTKKQKPKIEHNAPQFCLSFDRKKKKDIIVFVFMFFSLLKPVKVVAFPESDTEASWPSPAPLASAAS